MQFLIDLFAKLNNIQDLIIWGGYAALAAIVFAESGLFFGFFLPGDSLLVTAGLLASQNYLNIWELFFLLWLMAVAGDSVGYWFGKVTGPKIFAREKSILFAKSHLVRAQKFYEHHGGKAVILARFIPIIRTFAPIVAGVGKMQYRRFLAYNIIGGLLWVGSMLGTGWLIGTIFPGADKYLHYIIIVIVLLSITPGLIAWLKDKYTKSS